MRYLSIYISLIFELHVSIEKVSKSQDYNLLIVKTDNLNEIDLINVILRLKLIISIYKSYLLSKFSDHLEIIKVYDLKVSFDEDRNINVLIINKKDSEDLPELFVNITDILKKPVVSNRAVTYKFMNVQDFDYALVKDDIENLLDNLRKISISKIKPEELVRLNNIKKTFESSTHIVIEHLGNIGYTIRFKNR